MGMTETITGTNRSAGVTVQDMIPYDTRTVPDYLSRESIMPPGPTRVPVERYISKEFHDIVILSFHLLSVNSLEK